MPGNQDWARLQRRLSDSGYLALENVVNVVAQQDIGPALIAAIAAAEQSVTGHATVHDRIDVHDIGSFIGIDDALSARFCGVPDAGGNLGPLTFGSPGGRWSSGALRISINPTGANFVNPPGAPAASAVSVITNAFTQWQAASSFFSFSFVPPGTGEDIRVIFGGSGVDSRFGRAGGVLASAGYPEQGNLQFDSSEAWRPNVLLGTALHEIGHLLGLSHSNASRGDDVPICKHCLDD